MTAAPKTTEHEAGTTPRPASILAVIPALNEEAYIEACVRSLMTGSDVLAEVPLVVADGGSTDQTVDIVNSLMDEFPNLRLLKNPKRLQAAALNLAVQEYSIPESTYLVRCDAHSIYPKDFILSISKALMATKADSLVIPMDAVGTTCFEKANAWIVDTPLGSGGSVHRGGKTSGYVDHGHHAGFRLETFTRLGGYDESFSHNEDAEYDTRLSHSGGSIYLDADIRIQYVPRGSAVRLAKQYFSYGKGRARTVAKHGERLKIRQALPIAALIGSLGGILAAPFYLPTILLPLIYVAVLGAASLAVSFAKQSFCGLYAGLASGVMHMSWAAGFLSQVGRNLR